MKRYITIQLILTLFSAMLTLHSCGNEDDAVVQTSKRLIMNCTFAGFNGSATRASESEVNIADGARMYLDFDGLKTYAIYDKSTDTWSIEDWSDYESGTVTAHYHESLNEWNSPFEGRGTYQNTTEALTINVTLKPLTARLRFRGEPGKNVLVSGLQYYDVFSTVSYSFSSQSATFHLPIEADGYTSYIYATFASETKLTIEYDGDTYTETFSSNVLQPGKSGYIDLKSHETKITPEFSIEDYGEDEVLAIEDHETVDLGLPSGTLWATCNVGASKPEEYGDYFAWGETEPKTKYEWTTYKWCKGSETTMTKYCTDQRYGTVDNRKVLELADDVAYVKWGGTWHMPTKDQLVELFNTNYCKVTNNVYRNNVCGKLIESKVPGYEGSSIFLPGGGQYISSGISMPETCFYWTNTLYSTEYRACSLYGDFIHDTCERCYGRLVRPVCSK